MVIVIEKSASEEQIQQVIGFLNGFGFDVHRSSGVNQTVLGAIGVKPDFDQREVQLLPGVQKVFRVTEPYKLSSRSRLRPVLRPHQRHCSCRGAGSWSASPLDACKVVAEFAQGNRALNFHGVLGDAEFGSDVLLGHAVDFPQGEDLAAAGRKGLDGLGQEFEFLGARNGLRHVHALIKDVPQFRFR